MTKSGNHIMHFAKIGSFVGLGKPLCRPLDLREQVSVHNCGLDLSFLSAGPLSSYDRFICDGKLLTTDDYAQRFKRNNSVVMFGGNRFGSISSCLVSHSSGDSVVDIGNCGQCVLFTQEFEVARQYHFDDFVEINLLSIIVIIVRKAELVPVPPSSIVAKCVVVRANNTEYLIKLPQFEHD